MDDLKIAEQCIPKECKDDLVNRRQVYCLKLASESGLEFGQALIDMPSAEPEIIRCKECRFAHLTYDGDCKYCDKWMDEFGIPEELYLDGDFFCGYAERRTDE